MSKKKKQPPVIASHVDAPITHPTLSIAQVMWLNPFGIDRGDRVRTPQGIESLVIECGNRWAILEGELRIELKDLVLVEKLGCESLRNHFAAMIEGTPFRVDIFPSNQGEILVLHIAGPINDDGFCTEWMTEEELGNDISGFLMTMLMEKYSEFLRHQRIEAQKRPQAKKFTKTQQNDAEQLSLF